ncbi:hypothetical protein [Bacillus sp. T33-2]|uniref:hypothetical protein n=1 Tax=Bacillus sp. T33-2 TaxID=2054168 RepID=UPI000C7566FE|nr:hypothetical protein [Bacillus sp. T33-2]PLR97311.1 hypothetical protein CVD19_07425 [Bacillus sp. T33-2]
MTRQIKAFSAFICLLLLAAFVGQPVAAAPTGLKVTVDEGFDGKVKRGRGFPLTVTIENTGKDLRGDLLIDFFPSYNTGGSVSIPVDVAGNSSKTYEISLQGMTDEHQYQQQNLPAIHLYEGDWQDGKELDFKGEKTIKPRYIDPGEQVMGVLTENFDRLKELKVLPAAMPTQTLQLNKEEIPNEAMGLEMIDYLVIDEFAVSELEEKQQQAIQDWVYGGGVLIAGGAPDAKGSYGLLYSLLPMKPDSEGTVSSDFLSGNQHAKPGFHELNVFTGSVEKDASILFESSAKPAVIKKNLGTGTIIQSAFSLGDQPLASWKGYADWFSDLIKSGSSTNTLNGKYGTDLYDPLYYEFAESNEYFPTSNFSMGQLIGLLLGYIILIVPVLYLILRKFDNREHSWWIVPVIALGVSAAVFAIGAKDRISQPQLNQMGVFKAENGVLSGYQAATFLSNTSGTYKLSIPKENFHPVASTQNMSGMSYLADAVFQESRKETDVFFKAVEYWSSRTLYGKAGKTQSGSLNADLTVKDNLLTGTVENSHPYDFDEVFIWSGSEKIKIGPVKKGEMIKVNQSLKQSLLTGPAFMGGNPPMMPNQQPDFEAMKKERLENAAGVFVFGNTQSDNKPIIAGMTKDAVISVKIEGKQEKENNYNLILEPFVAKGEITGPFTLTNDSLASKVNVIKGRIHEQMGIHEKNAIFLEDGEYEYVLGLPDQVKNKAVKLEELSIRLNGQFVKYEVLNQQTGQYTLIEDNRLVLAEQESAQEYISKDGQLVLKLTKQSNGDPYVSLPTIKMKGEVAK